MKRYYLNNNKNFGKLKIFDENNNCIAKVKNVFLQNAKILVNNNDQFLLRIDEVDIIKHRFTVSFDENASNLQMEIAKKNNFKVGFGLGHFVLLPLASIPFGSYYGVSKRGDIYIRKNGKLHEICVNNSIIARIEVKKGMFAQMMNSKSCLEVLTSDNTLIMYAIALFVIREINDYFK